MLKKYIIIFMIFVFGALPGRSQVFPGTEVEGCLVTDKVWSTLGLAKQNMLQLKLLCGTFSKLENDKSPDSKISVIYIKSLKKPKYTIIVGWSKVENRIFLVDVKPTMGVRPEQAEYGDQEAWVPLNNGNLLVWSLALKDGLIANASKIFAELKSNIAPTLFLNVDITSPAVKELMAPIRPVPRNDQTDEYDLVWGNKRLVMERSPRAFWR